MEKTDPMVKKLGDSILMQTRNARDKDANFETDPDFWFKVNRWVFARLQEDERKIKDPIKKHLLKSQNKCLLCPKSFKSGKEIEIHRKDATKCYRLDNCILLCRHCHQLLHKSVD